jgi:hypothetical protein
MALRRWLQPRNSLEQIVEVERFCDVGVSAELEAFLLAS